MNIHFINQEERHFKDLKPKDVFFKPPSVYAMKVKDPNWNKLCEKNQGLAVDLQDGDLFVVANDHWVIYLPEAGLNLA